jgi:DNA-binding transcriptional MerR regulator
VSKGPDAFRTISEVAEELDLPQHVLRFWETRFTQIKPLKRGGGRRYYRPDDIDLLRGIRHLLYGEGYTIRGVQRILHEQGQRFVVSAGRGELAGLEVLTAVNGDDDHDHGGDDDHDYVEPTARTAMDEEETDDADSVPPAFDPREFRASAPGNGVHDRKGAAERLTTDELDRLRSTLAELLELKRLLDQAR